MLGRRGLATEMNGTNRPTRRPNLTQQMREDLGHETLDQGLVHGLPAEATGSRDRETPRGNRTYNDKQLHPSHQHHSHQTLPGDNNGKHATGGTADEYLAGCSTRGYRARLESTFKQQKGTVLPMIPDTRRALFV